MIEKVKLGRVPCRGRGGRQLTVARFQFFDTITTAKGTRRRPGAIRLELETGEEVRQVDTDCFEVIDTGELVMTAAVSRLLDPDTTAASDIPLCRHEELARQENRLRKTDQAGKASSRPSVQAARSSSAGPKNS